MINTIHGIITDIGEQKITFELQALGISCIFFTPRAENFNKSQTATLFVHMHWNQELGPSFFGFQTSQERDVFAVLLGCSGIGPKVALALLQAMQPHELAGAINTGDCKTLAHVKGIGTKKAEHMLVHLKNKLDQFNYLPDQRAGTPAPALTQVADVLYSLSYSRQEVQRALSHVREQSFDGSPTFDVLVRSALAVLSKKISPSS